MTRELHIVCSCQNCPHTKDMPEMGNHIDVSVAAFKKFCLKCPHSETPYLGDLKTDIETQEREKK